ncbi:hypothetical protein [Erwinia phage FBB1]|nr:hypothetical protein [Erwinia phage FBB1]
MDYRQRATIAEQKVAELTKVIEGKPDHECYKWFVELIRRHLNQSENVPPQHLAFQVKQLKMARGHLIK